MNFWDDHTVMYILGVIFIPRIMLIWFGMIPPVSIQPILGLIFAPRLFLAGALTKAYWDSNPVVVVIVWILAIILDVIGFIVKSFMGSQMAKMQMEVLQKGM